jgi:hypothetical protein
MSAPPDVTKRLAAARALCLSGSSGTMECPKFPSLVGDTAQAIAKRLWRAELRRRIERAQWLLVNGALHPCEDDFLRAEVAEFRRACRQ